MTDATEWDLKDEAPGDDASSKDERAAASGCQFVTKQNGGAAGVGAAGAARVSSDDRILSSSAARSSPFPFPFALAASPAEAGPT